MKKLLVIEIKESGMRVTLASKDGSNFAMKEVESNVDSNDLSARLKTVVLSLQADRAPAVIAVPREWVLLLPTNEPIAGDPVLFLRYLPPAFTGAFHTVARSKDERPSFVILSRKRWRTCVEVLSDAGLRPFGAIFSPSFQDLAHRRQMIEELFSSETSWLVPPLKFIWNRLAWTAGLEQEFSSRDDA